MKRKNRVLILGKAVRLTLGPGGPRVERIRYVFRQPLSR